MRKVISKLAALTLAFCLMVPFSSYAGWEQTGTTWKYKDNSQGIYLTGWQWLDSNNDNIAECYYLDSTGVMVSNTVIEGYTINDLGQWTVNGVVQTKATQNQTQTQSKTKETQASVQPTQPQVQPTQPEVQPTEAVSYENNDTTELSPEMQERQRQLDERKAQGKGSFTHEADSNTGHGGDDLKDADTSHLNIGGMN